MNTDILDMSIERGRLRHHTRTLQAHVSRRGRDIGSGAMMIPHTLDLHMEEAK